jgi:hypothetical protein
LGADYRNRGSCGHRPDRAVRRRSLNRFGAFTGGFLLGFVVLMARRLRRHS